MSIFSFSHSVFNRLVTQGRQKVLLSGNGLIYGLQTVSGKKLVIWYRGMASVIQSIHFQACLQFLTGFYYNT